MRPWLICRRRRGKIYLQKFLDAAANAGARMAEPDYLEMLSYFASRQKGRTLFVVLTDLVDTWGSRSLLSALASVAPEAFDLLCCTCQ